MKTSMTTLGRLGVSLAAFAVTAAAPMTASAALDGSVPFLCAVNTIMECDGRDQCQRHTALEQLDFPSFLRINVAQQTITDGQNSERRTRIESTKHLNGRLILHGGENGRGWAATIAEDTGRMSAGVVADDFTFVLFGTCTTP